jgi:hypothetical protein
MAENDGTTQTEPTAPVDPQGSQIDWKAMSRKHEDNEKRYKEQLDAANAKVASLESGAQELQQLREQLASITSERDQLQRQHDLRTWADEVSAETHVPASVLRGSSKEEMQSHAQAILGSGLSFGAVPDGGEANPPAVPRAQIDAIKDPHERLMATAKTLNLYK